MCVAAVITMHSVVWNASLVEVGECGIRGWYGSMMNRNIEVLHCAQNLSMMV